MKDNVLGFLGILFRANKAMIGEAAKKEKNIALAFLAKDASETTKKEIRNLLAHGSCPTIEDYSKAELGGALGYSEVSFLCIVDKKAAKSLEKKRKEIR